MLSLAESSGVYLHDNGSLVLNSVTELEEGLYSCLAKNYLGSAEVFVDVTILSTGVSGADQSLVLGSDPDGFGEDGTRLSLTCLLNGTQGF